ncbi:MAG TPA: tetratricopeptide repeat protein [Methylomirabilota bacterium]|nr:tetratricopeptide repeat protein [Methylomirabilota bacterium]
MSEPSGYLESSAVRLGLKIAVVMVALAVLAGAGWFWLRAEDNRGLTALAATADLVQEAAGPQATADTRRKAISALQTVLDQHARSSAAPQAAYQLGNLQYQAGDFAAARAAYQVALAKGATASVRTLAAVGIGYTWEAQKNYANALTAYDAVVRDVAPRKFFHEEALLDLARAQTLAGKPGEAIATYERLLKDAPDTRRAPDVRAKILELESRAK